MESDRELQVIIAAGPEDAQRAILGLALAVSASSAGTRVGIYFAMNGARCLTADFCSKTLVVGYPSVGEFLEILKSEGVLIEYCPHCTNHACPDNSVESPICLHCSGAQSKGMFSLGARMASIPTVVF